VLKTYLPALVFLVLGLVTGGAFVQLNKVLGPVTGLVDRVRDALSGRAS